MSGPITRIVVDTGARVKAGDPLLYVASADVTNADLDLPQGEEPARSRAAHARPQQGSARAQGARRSATSKRRRPTTTTPRPTCRPRCRRSKIFGVLAGRHRPRPSSRTSPIQPELAMRAPIAGTVVQKLVLPGQFIQAGTTAAFVISNIVDGLGAGARLRQGSARRCTSATRSTSATRRSREPFHGVVSYIGDMLDPATRTTPVRIVTQNPAGLLKKDLFVDVVDPRQGDARRAGRADRRGALRRAELAVRLRAGRRRASSRSGWSRSAASRTTTRRSPTASRRATASSRRAASSCSSPTRYQR